MSSELGDLLFGSSPKVWVAGYCFISQILWSRDSERALVRYPASSCPIYRGLSMIRYMGYMGTVYGLHQVVGLGVLLLGGSCDLVATPDWAYGQTYSLPSWPHRA